MRGIGSLLLSLILFDAIVAGATDSPPAASAPRSFYGSRIASLEFQGDAPVDEGSLRKLTELNAGEILTESAVRTSMRNLFATRRFSDLSIEAVPRTSGLAIRVVFSAAPTIVRLTLEGEHLPNRGRLRDSLRVDAGDPWTTGESAVAEVTLRRLLKERGYFEPKIETRVEAGPDETSVLVRFLVATGPRAFAIPPRWKGSIGSVDPSKLAKAARLKPGTPYREVRAREDAERYTGFYRKLGFARAEVRFDGEIYEAASRRVSPQYAVFVGPHIVLQVTGAPISDVKKHPESPWSRGEPPDEDSIRRLAEAVKRSYQEKGYGKVQVVWSYKTGEAEDTISFQITKGDRWTVAHVTYEGTHTFTGKDLKGVTQTRPRGFLEVGRLVDRTLEEDRNAIAGFYSSQGFADARAGKPVTKDGTSPFTLDVKFPVEEGARLFVERRTIEGDRSIPASELEPFLAVTPGSPYDPALVKQDEAVLQGIYTERGFVDSRIESETKQLTPAPPRPLGAAITYKVFEGDPVTFGKSVVRGNRRTRFSIIGAQFAHKEGIPFSLSRLIETQQGLTRLGVFQRVDITYFPTDPERKSRTVIITLSEAKPWSLLYGIGAEYNPSAERRFNPRFSLGISYNNLFGRAMSVGAEGRYSIREQRVVATLRDRSLFRWRLPLSLTLFDAKEIRENFEVKRRGAFIETERRFSPSVKSTLRYQYEIVEPKADPAILSGLERQNQQIAISSFGPGLTIDTRSDPVDPKFGYLIATDLRYAFPFLSANARFLKGLVQASLYRPFEGTTFAFGLRAGAIQPYGRCSPQESGECAPNLEIPIVERFFAGGRTTHRAFSLDDLGIAGQTTLNGIGFGGNGLLVANAEWRIPVFGDLGVSFFVDVGNVWADYRRIRLSELRAGVGVGAHYLTPVGPLRVEYGRKLDRQPGESLGEFSFSIGYPF